MCSVLRVDCNANLLDQRRGGGEGRTDKGGREVGQTKGKRVLEVVKVGKEKVEAWERGKMRKTKWEQ